MSDDLKVQALEQSLINYLTRIEEVDKRVSGGFKRVRSLTLDIDIKNPKQPLLCVTIGMMSAHFNIKDGLKIRGNCYGIDKYIRDWIINVNIDLERVVISMSVVI